MAGLQLDVAEHAIAPHPCSARGVEIAHVASAVRDHHRVTVAVTRRDPPVIDEQLAKRRCVAVGDEPSVIAVLCRPGVNPSGAQVAESGLVPRLALSLDLTKLDRTQAIGERAESATCLDLGQLAIVANEQQLGVRCLGMVGESRQDAGRHHSGFVDDQDRVPLELVPSIQVGEGASDRRAVDARRLLELERRASSQRAAVGADPIGLPKRPSLGQGACLARAGGRANDLDAGSRGRDPSHQLLLFVRQVTCALQVSLDSRRRDGRGCGGASLRGA